MVLVAALLIAVIFVIYLLLRPEVAGRPMVPEARGVLVTPDNVVELQEWLQTPIEDAHFTVNMNAEWFFERWNTPSINAHVENSTLNTRTVYLNLILDETGELLFTSPYMPVGSRLDQVTLNSRLESGSHPATVVYHLVDDYFNEITTVAVAVLLHIQQ